MMRKVCIGATLRGHVGSRKSGIRQSANMAGFTLVELLLTVMILSILATLAFPNIKSSIRSYQLTSKANNVINALNRARSEAAKRGLRVTICSSTNGTSCAASSQNNWHQGWIMFVDSDSNAAVSTGEVIIQYEPGDTVFTIVLSGTSSYVSFVPSGMPKTSGFSWWSGSIDVRRVGDSVSDPGRRVTLGRAGSMRVDKI